MKKTGHTEGGSSIAGLVNPYRHDMVAVSGEVTAGPALENLYER